MDLFYFTLLVSVLVFVHELGHFSLAKIFGVKVLTFSLGFGPKIVRIRGKETEYCIGILPFGGFVNMLEESKGTNPIPPEDRARTFEAQALWKRIAIVLAGPMMNVLFPIGLYTSIYFSDKELLPPNVGATLPAHPADGKLLPGDRILAVDDRAVTSFTDVQRIVGKRAGKSTKFSIERDGKKLDVPIVVADEIEERDEGMVEHIGRVGIIPTFPAPIIGVPRVDSPAYRAGLRTFDRITSINGRRVDRMIDLVDALTQNRGDALVIAYMRPEPIPEATNGLCDLALLDPQVATVTPLPKAPGTKEETATLRAADALLRTGIESSEMYAVFVPEGSSEWKAGLRANDRITSIDNVPQTSWQQLQSEIIQGRSRTRRLEWTREGEAMAGTFQVQSEQWRDEWGTPYARYVFRTTHWAAPAPDKLVPNESRLSYALAHGFEDTWRAVRVVSVGMLRIVQGRVSLASSMSGPITLYDIAGQAGAKGTTYFASAMALVSINLGLINLLPVPVLDGGHLAFFFVEGILRKPVPRRIREIASLIGVVMLVVLMGLAFKNDVERRWGSISHQVHELFT